MCIFITIELLIGIVHMPAYTDYWSQNFRYKKSASIMPLKRYQSLRNHLHFDDDNNLQNDDQYFKIRPLLKRNCLAKEGEKNM